VVVQNGLDSPADDADLQLLVAFQNIRLPFENLATPTVRVKITDIRNGQTSQIILCHGAPAQLPFLIISECHPWHPKSIRVPNTHGYRFKKIPVSLAIDVKEVNVRIRFNSQVLRPIHDRWSTISITA